MKQKRIDAWKRIRSIGKGRFIFDRICMFYFIVSIITTLIDLWPDGKFINFGDFLTKVIVLIITGIIIGLIAWNNNEKELKKANSNNTAEKAVKTDSKSRPTSSTRKERKRKRKAVPFALPKDPKETYGLCERCGQKKIECKCNEEPEAIKVVREKLKKTIIGSDVKRVTALSVVMMLQGLGEYDMANVLLDKYNLLPLGIKQRKS